MKRLHHHLTEAQLDALTTLSKQGGLSVAELIRRAVDVYLKADEVSKPNTENPTYRELSVALFDMLDGQSSSHEIRIQTGLNWQRADEICDIFHRITVKE